MDFGWLKVSATCNWTCKIFPGIPPPQLPASCSASTKLISSPQLTNWQFQIPSTMCSLHLLLSITAFIVTVVLPRMIHAVPLSRFYPYGTMAGDTTLHRNDDDYSPAISITGSGFRFFGTDYDNIFVSFYIHIAACISWST